MAKDARVNWFVFWTFAFFGLYCWSLAQAWTVFDVRWLAVSFASIGAVVMLLDRKRQHDDLCLPSVGISLPAAENSDQPTEVIVRPQIQSENGHRIRYAKFNLTKKQWESLAHAIFAANGRVIRDVIARANAFTNLTSKWPQIYKEFERLGWVENGELTDAGKQWFSQFTTPPAPLESMPVVGSV